MKDFELPTARFELSHHRFTGERLVNPLIYIHGRRRLLYTARSTQKFGQNWLFFVHQ